MKCIIVDDEPLAREGIELHIQEIKYLELAGQFSNALSANNFLASTPVDLMFLDIQMPGITGLEFMRSLKNKPLVILTTAYPEFALEGFELDVVDYLLKPVRLERFVMAVNRARNQFSLQKENPLPEMEEKEYYYFKSERQYLRVFLDDILFVRGMKDYVMIHTKKEKFMTAMNIKTINSQLPDSTFVRVSKSYIINSNYIDSVSHDYVKLGSEEIPLGNTYKDYFVNTFIKSRLISRK